MNEIAKSELKSKLTDHYGSNIDRDLVKHERADGHDDTGGSVVYSLRGSPPKGYAIAIPELRKVSLYDHHGKRFRKLTETAVVED